MNASTAKIIGRFAPTPSGPLHFGSLVAAVASYCAAKSRQGTWLVRMEDLDTPRVVKGSADDILFSLEKFGFEWDATVMYQSERFDAYEQAIEQLESQGLLYRCQCTRKSLAQQNLQTGTLGVIYPGICREKHYQHTGLSLRINTQSADKIQFNDSHYGPYTFDIKHQVGDFVVKRADGIYAYHLAVVVDDAFQNVNQIVRGADLLESTGPHLYLNKLLKLPDAQYMHIPLVKTKQGEKLSKQTAAAALDPKHASGQLAEALTFLGQPVPGEYKQQKPQEILRHAINNWSAKNIPDKS